MISFIMGSQKAEIDQEDLIIEDDLSLSAWDSYSVEDDSEGCILKLKNAAERNIFKGYFQKGCQQIEELEEIVRDYKKQGSKIPSEIASFMESEEKERIRANKKTLDKYLRSIQTFSEEWEIYKENKNWTI